MLRSLVVYKQKTAYEMLRSLVGSKQKTAYEMLRSLVGSEMCIRDRDVPVAVLPGGVAGLGPVGLHAVLDSDLREPAAVMDQDPSELAVGEPPVGCGEPLGRGAQRVEGGEPFGVVHGAEPLEDRTRDQSVEP